VEVLLGYVKKRKGRYTITIYPLEITQQIDSIAKLLALQAGEVVNLDGANFVGYNMKGAVLDGVSMVGADLRRCKLRGADLRGADLRRCRLQGADLREADLREAVLNWANMTGADLRGCRLEGASLVMTVMIGVKR